MSTGSPMFQSDEILWYDNGRWGQCGYAVANPAGKTYTVNAPIYEIHSLLGLTLFELMHREDVRFSGPPHKQFWYDLHQAIVSARKRLSDRSVAPNDSNRVVIKHAAPTPQAFLCYPIPYFGERIRQKDVREYCTLGLLLLSEIMQHSENEKLGYITPGFAGVCGNYLQEILAQMSMKYFNKTREQAYDPAFALTDEDFKTYDPSKVLTSFEMTEERPPLQWWPTENDLSEIRGRPINEVLPLCKRWPSTDLLDEANGNVLVDGTSTSAAKGGAVSGAFVLPNRAP